MATDLLDYIAQQAREPGTRVPPITELSETFGISPSKLREQLEVARAMEFVEVRPKTGIRTRKSPTCRPFGLVFFRSWPKTVAFRRDPDSSHDPEAAYWKEAVGGCCEDLDQLERLVGQAWGKLRGTPIQIPHAEHKALHLTVFSRLPNLLVRALLEAYWEAYEAIGLSLYADYAYLREVWTYHETMVRAIRAGDAEAGLQALVQHTGLLRSRSDPMSEAGAPASSDDNWKGDLA
jgi:DNA-binding FadR family transcriptional regulator